MKLKHYTVRGYTKRGRKKVSAIHHVVSTNKKTANTHAKSLFPKTKIYKSKTRLHRPGDYERLK